MIEGQSYSRWEIVFIVAENGAAKLGRLLADSDARVQVQPAPAGMSAESNLERCAS